MPKFVVGFRYIGALLRPNCVRATHSYHVKSPFDPAFRFITKVQKGYFPWHQKCFPGSNGVRTKRGPSKCIHEGPPCPGCGLPRGGRRIWAVGWFSGLAKPPWQPEYPVPELPYVRGLEAHPRGSRVRSQHNEISASRLAPGSGLYPVSCQAGVLEYRNKLCRLPRRHPSPANGG